jgi:hypothetical protein
MAWTNPTYTNTYAIGTSGSIKYGMFELGRAINERQGHVGITKTQWYKADGTQAADIAITDLVGMQINGTHFKTNLSRIYTAIQSMAGYFTVSPSSLTEYTAGTLATAVGASLSPTLSNVSAFQASLFQVAQDALDLLIYIQEAESVQTGATSDSVNEEFSGSYRSGIADPPSGELDTPQDAWDALGAYTYTAGQFKGFYTAIYKYTSGGYGTEYDATRKVGSQNVEVDFSSYGYTGDAASTWYRVDWNNDFDDDIDWTFGGAAGTGSSAAHSITYFLGDVVPLDSMFTVSLVTEYDASASPPAGTYVTSLDAAVVPVQCVCVIDLTPYLTDQA